MLAAPESPIVVPAPPGPRRRWPLLVGGLLLVLLVAGAAVVLAGPLSGWLLGRSATRTTALIPADAPAVVHIAPTANQLKNFTTLKTRLEAVPEIKNALKELEQTFTEGQGITFQNDIQPWLGPEMALVFHKLPVTANARAATNPPDLVFLAATIDRGKSDAFFKKLRDEAAKKGKPLSQQQYSGVTYDTDGKEQWATTLNDFVIFANTEAALRRTIDLTQGKGGPTLADAPTYQEMAKALPADRFAIVYLDYQKLQAEALRDSTLSVTPEQRRVLEAFRAAAFALRFETNGVLFDAFTLIEPGNLTTEQATLLNQKGGPLRVVDKLPAKTGSFIALRDLRTIWNAVSASLRNDRSFTTSLDDIKKATGLSVDEDIFGWMTGEVGLALAGDNQGITVGRTHVPYGGLLLVEATDRPLIESKLKKIRTALEGQGIRAISGPVRGVETTQLSFGNMLTLTYGYVGDFLVITTSPESFGQVVDTGNAGLAATANYQRTNEVLLKDRTALFYVDVAATYKLVDSLGTPSGPRSRSDRQTEATLRPFKAIAITGSSLQGKLQQAQLFVLIPD